MRNPEPREPYFYNKHVPEHIHVLTIKSQYLVIAGCPYFCEAFDFGSGFKESFDDDSQNEVPSALFT